MKVFVTDLPITSAEVKIIFIYKRLVSYQSIKCQYCPNCCANQLTGFYMRATLALNGLKARLGEDSQRNEKMQKILHSEQVKLILHQNLMFFWPKKTLPCIQILFPVHFL